MLIVQKYGGSSVANAERIINVANRIAEYKDEGHQLVVVLSAQGDTTDDLIAKAKEINEKPSKREMDMLLSTGEQQSVALMCMALEKKGYHAVSLNGQQVGMYTSSAHSNARIHKIDSERINMELDKSNIVIVAGFQGINKFGDITTLGRGGSDTTAVAIAASLHADLCQIYTDVDGVYTADPRIVKTAKKLDVISYDEMLELASLGAQVLHNRSVELAKKYRVKLVVCSSLTKEEGTLVKEDKSMEKMLVSGVAVDKDVARIALVGIDNAPGKAFHVFSVLAKHKISVDIILQSIGRGDQKDISFTVSREDLEETVKVLTESQDELGFDEISSDNKIAKLSIVGAGMTTNPGVAAIMFEALYDAGINIKMISTSEIKISVLIDEDKADMASIQVHDKFISKNIIPR